MSQPPSVVHEAELRATVQIKLPDTRVYEIARYASLAEVFRVAYPDEENPAVAAIVDGELRELAWPIERDAEVAPVFLSDSDGLQIYSRSLSFLLVVVATQLFPDAGVRIDYSVPHGGYFCLVEGRKPFTARELTRIKNRMLELVREDHPIVRTRCTLEEAKKIFTDRGELGKVRLFEARKVDHLHLYVLDGISDYFYGYMVPSTRFLKLFGLEPFADGFILRFPRREDPTKLLPPRNFKALREVFDEYGKRLALLGMRNVVSLNEAIRSGRIEQIVLVSEALHEKRIAEIASQIAARHDKGVRLVFIAGPSASGKTTFSKRLAIQLLANGLHPYPLAMDNYFHPRRILIERYGDDIDVDSLDAVDLTQFQEDLRRLVAGEDVVLPRFDFRTGLREQGPTVRISPSQVLLVEGIHGMNPRLLEDSPLTSCFRIFISALTQINLDQHNRVSTTDTRLIRRIVRDAHYRGYSATETLTLWENVRRGEKRNIFPYQEQADVMFNSALGYELAVLKPLVEPLLLQVREPKLRIEAERLLALLWWFDAYAAKSIPGNSILREFVGGSSLQDLTPVPHGLWGTSSHEDRAGVSEGES